MNELKTEIENTLKRLIEFHLSTRNDIVIQANAWEAKISNEDEKINLGKRMIPSSNVGFRHELQIEDKAYYVTVDLNISDSKPLNR